MRKKKREARPATAKRALEAHVEQQHAKLPSWCSEWGTERGKGYVERLDRIRMVAEGKL